MDFNTKAQTIINLISADNLELEKYITQDPLDLDFIAQFLTYTSSLTCTKLFFMIHQQLIAFDKATWTSLVQKIDYFENGEKGFGHPNLTRFLHDYTAVSVDFLKEIGLDFNPQKLEVKQVDPSSGEVIQNNLNMYDTPLGKRLLQEFSVSQKTMCLIGK